MPGPVPQTLHLIERNRCDCYSLVGEEGADTLGWSLSLPASKKMDADTLAAGLRQ